ncbi:HAT-like protein [Stemphylium lycopersici]|nr:HAT-like protein [Stemphylium lycopersici]
MTDADPEPDLPSSGDNAAGKRKRQLASEHVRAAYSVILASIVAMSPPRPPKRPHKNVFTPNKRAKVAARGTKSQPFNIDESHQLPQRLSPRKALATAASQATEPPTFES